MSKKSIRKKIAKKNVRMLELRSFKKRHLSRYSKQQLFHFAMEAVCSNDVSMLDLLMRNGFNPKHNYGIFGALEEIYPKNIISESFLNGHNNDHSIQKAALINDDEAMLDFMVQKGILLRNIDYYECPRIFQALFHVGYVNAAKAFVKNTHVDMQLHLCMPTLLSIAASSGNKELVDYLLENGANVHGHPYEPDEYIDFSSFISTEDKNGVYPHILTSQVLSEDEKYDMMNYMFDKGANPAGITDLLEYPYEVAGGIGSGFLDWFVKKGIDISPGIRLICINAIENDTVDVLQYLIEKKYDISNFKYLHKDLLESAANDHAIQCFEYLYHHPDILKHHEIEHYLKLSHYDGYPNIDKTKVEEGSWYARIIAFHEMLLRLKYQ